MRQLSQINGWQFWPPFVLMTAAVACSIAMPESFQLAMNGVNDWIIDNCYHWFNYTAFCMVLLCVAALFSPVAKVKIGGANAVPLFSRWRWFSIVLCTSVAVGILFWGTAEPLFHLNGPPATMSDRAMESLAPFAMGTMFMHWSFTPYAIYCIPAILFALGFYNQRRSFSLYTMLFPISTRNHGSLERLINVACLFALVAGMAASLGAGLLSIAGGVERLWGIPVSGASLAAVSMVVVLTFVLSAVSGILRGIKWLSTFNLFLFAALAIAVLLMSPTLKVLEHAMDGVIAYALNFIPHSLGIGIFSDREWGSSWTTFYWANWMAWAPITALFMGRISVGYTVRDLIIVNWILPSLFSMFWMSVFSGAVIEQQLTDGALIKVLEDQGAQAVIYQMIASMPMAGTLAALFVLSMFISYVTAADSNTVAMSGLSSRGISPNDPVPPNAVKVAWGIIVGAIAFVMISFAGIDGIKILSNLGGLPSLLLLTACCIAMIRLIFFGKHLQ